jgi:hypothetical protein
VGGLVDSEDRAGSECDQELERCADAPTIVSVVGENSVDDLLTRTEDRAKMPRASDAEVRRAQERLRVVEQNISHFKFLRAALQTRFPDTKI